MFGDSLLHSNGNQNRSVCSLGVSTKSLAKGALEPERNGCLQVDVAEYHDLCLRLHVPFPLTCMSMSKVLLSIRTLGIWNWDPSY